MYFSFIFTVLVAQTSSTLLSPFREDTTRRVLTHGGGQRLGWLGFRRNLDCYRRTRHTTKVSSLSQNRSHDIFSLGSETPFFDLSPVFPLTAQLIISLRIPWSPFRYRGTPASDLTLIHCGSDPDRPGGLFLLLRFSSS